MRRHAGADRGRARAGAPGLWVRSRERGDRLEKLKAIDPETYPQEVLADEEPRYLRRQKPLEIKRRKFGKRAWKTYLRVTVGVLAAMVIAGIVYEIADFLYASPRMALLHPEQIQIRGNRYVSRPAALETFLADRGHSVLRIPLEERRRQIEAIPWVGRATVRRVLPNHVEVEVTERTPVAYLRQGPELALIDAQGVILERPLEGDFRFPVVTGITPRMAHEERQRRMRLLSEFLDQIDLARPGSSEQVSEADLGDANDLRAMFERLPGVGASDASGATGNEAMVVHFGDRDFQNRFRLLLENIADWRAKAGRVESVDLRFNREAVVNPELGAVPAKTAAPAKNSTGATRRSGTVRNSAAKRHRVKPKPGRKASH